MTDRMSSGTEYHAIYAPLTDAALLTAYTTLGTPEEFAALKREHGGKCEHYEAGRLDGCRGEQPCYYEGDRSLCAVEEAKKDA